jgi:hypothetical protein
LLNSSPDIRPLNKAIPNSREPLQVAPSTAGNKLQPSAPGAASPTTNQEAGKNQLSALPTAPSAGTLKKSSLENGGDDETNLEKLLLTDEVEVNGKKWTITVPLPSWLNRSMNGGW